MEETNKNPDENQVQDTTAVGQVEVNIDEIFEIMKPQIDKYLDETVVINLYKKYGILSLDSVRIFKLLL